MSGLRKLWLHSTAPVPRRTLYRRRVEAERRQRDLESSDSEEGSRPQNIPSCDNISSDCTSNPRSRSNSSNSSESDVESQFSFEGGSDEQSSNDNESIRSIFPCGSDQPQAEELGHSEDEVEEIVQEEGQNRGNDAAVNEDVGRQALLNDPLCPCTTTTEGDALLMCLALGIRHNMTWVAIVDLLTLINNLYGKEVIHSSKHFLMKFFDIEKESAIAHVYCPSCEAYLGTQDFVMEENILQCECGEAVKMKGSSSPFFISVQLKARLKSLMETPEVAQEILTYRFQRQKVNDDAIEDIFDGEGYKKFAEPGQILHERTNFSFTMNTDGMDLGTSSNRSAWPIFLYVNELSPENRKKHVIFAGIWVGKKQPNMRIFLTPFIEELSTLSRDGFEWTDVNGTQQTSKVVPLIAVLDSGARYKFLNLTSYSGYYGCTFCYQKAENTNKGRRFTIVQNKAELRTQVSMMKDMQKAHENRNHANPKKRSYRGCKGFTPLVRLHPYLNLGSGVIVDFMHNALLGVTRSHTAIVLQRTGNPFYIGTPENMHDMDTRLQRMKPPTSMSRTPRDLKHFKKFKANEWRLFVLYYGLLCYDGVLKQKYLEHFAMLSAAIFIILQKSITLTELETAQKYLVQFVYLHEQYFGKISMTYNVHLLLHVAQAVQEWGPVWGPNTFIFEGENRHMSQMNTSSGHVAHQLTRRYRIFSSFPKLCELYASPSEKPIEFLEKITGKSLKSFVRCSGAVLVGTGHEDIIDENYVPCLVEAGFHGNFTVRSFKRMFYGKIRYTTKDYAEGKKNDDSWIKTKYGTRGNILKIWHVEIQNRTEVVILLQEYIIDKEPVLRSANISVTHIKRVLRPARLRIIKPPDIAQQCFFFSLHRGVFISDVPYGCYGD